MLPKLGLEYLLLLTFLALTGRCKSRVETLVEVRLQKSHFLAEPVLDCQVRLWEDDETVSSGPTNGVECPPRILRKIQVRLKQKDRLWGSLRYIR